MLAVVERLPGQRGELEQDTPEQAAPAPLQSAPGVDVARPAALDRGSVLALQRSAGNAAVAAMVQRALADSPAREAPPPRPQPSPSLALRAKLRSGPSIGRAVLQRAVTTSGGEWDTVRYDLLKDVDSAGTVYTAAQGVRGLIMDLKFKPNDEVDAEMIGLTQSVQAFVGGAPNLTPAAATRAIPAKDAQALDTGAGETDEGTAIDRAAGYNNPIYGVASAASTSLEDTNRRPGTGQHGWHYKNKAGAVQHRDATLWDGPVRGGAAKDSRHIFETTALATKGAQAGTYYGSVRWGWRTDSTEKFTKLPLEKVSDGVPSATFLKAASIWNPGKSSTGAENVDLPIPDVKVNAAPVTLAQPIPMVDLTLPIGTRMQILEDLVGPMLNGRVKVIDGPHTGATGEVAAAEWSLIQDERA